MSRRPTTNPPPKHSAHHPVVISKHESCADGISKGADLLLPKHELQEVGFPFRKFLEISGGRRSAVGGRLRSAVGLPPPEVRFPWKFPESCFLSRAEGSDFQKNRLEIWVSNTQPSRRTIVHRAPPAGAAGPRRDEWGERLECMPDGPRGGARAESKRAFNRGPATIAPASSTRPYPYSPRAVSGVKRTRPPPRLAA